MPCGRHPMAQHGGQQLTDHRPLALQREPGALPVKCSHACSPQLAQSGRWRQPRYCWSHRRSSERASSRIRAAYSLKPGTCPANPLMGTVFWAKY
jgi:hypothetical protein